MLRPFESRISEKCENARNRRIAVFSATRSPIDARFVASDGKSKPPFDRRNGFFDFDPRNFWGAKWGVLHFWTKCATEFFRSKTSCGKVVDLVDTKPTQKTGPKNSHGRPRYREFSKFSGIRNSPIGNGTVSVARRAKFGRAQRASRCGHTRAVRNRRSRDRSASFDTIRISVGRRVPELRIAENDASARIWSVSVCGAQAYGASMESQ
jgi:hypothetical protein